MNKSFLEAACCAFVSEQNKEERKLFFEDVVQQPACCIQNFLERNSSKHSNIIELQSKINLWEEKGIKHISIFSDAYPALLALIDDPPPILFYRGNIHALNASKENIAIVGARKAEEHTKRISFRFAKELAEQHVCIVSGLAFGVDANAHQGVLSSAERQRTIAVLGNGLETIYPKLHTKLAENIVQNGGLLISQFLPKAKPLPHHFLNRNRVIAALSTATIVIQAAKRSGSLVTARYANEYGRTVAAIPERIDNPAFSGNNHLIKEGAHLVTNTDDILELIGIEKHVVSEHNRDTLSLNTKQREIIEALASHSKLQSDEIEKKLQTTCLDEELLVLELKGYVKRLPGGFLSLTHLCS